MADSPSWEPDAKAFFDAILADLPFFIRGQARTATAERAESDARTAGGPVTRDGVVTAMIAITPPPMQAQLKALLSKHGVR